MDSSANMDPIPGSQRIQIGPFFFGVIWNWFLMGILLLQLYLYTLRKRKDSFWLTSFMCMTVALDMAETGTSTHGAYQILVEYWGVQSIEVHVPKTFTLLPLWDALVASAVQFFFGWRIWKISKGSYGRIVVPIILVLSLCQSGGALVSTILEEKTNNHLALQGNLNKVYIGYLVWQTTNLAVDIVIAVTMLAILRTAKSSTHFSATQNLISRLIRQVVTTGVVTATMVAIELGFFLHKKGNNFFVTPAYTLGKLYSNSLLANLNARPDEGDLPANSASQVHTSGTESHELHTFQSRLRFRQSQQSHHHHHPHHHHRPKSGIASAIQVRTVQEVVSSSPVDEEFEKPRLPKGFMADQDGQSARTVDF